MRPPKRCSGYSKYRSGLTPCREYSRKAEGQTAGQASGSAKTGLPSTVSTISKHQMSMSDTDSVGSISSLSSASLGPVRTPLKGSRGVEGWWDLRVSPVQLRPEFSLTMGQAFNWNRAGGQEYEWVGVLGERVLAMRQTHETTLVKVLGSAVAAKSREEEEAQVRAELHDYFQLQHCLSSLYEQWGAADPRMHHVATHIPGVRVLRQDPVECLFSFICSSNNNIPRITLMLARLRARYGTSIPLYQANNNGTANDSHRGKKRPRTHGGSEDDEDEEEEEEGAMGGVGGYYSFPTLTALARASEDDLRALGFGYRAKFIVQTAQKLQELGGREWLLSLRTQSRLDAQSQLLQLSGVGRKVADCVALFSLDQQGAIPVDVHVWRIACRDYDPSLTQAKSLTPAVYERVGELFRQRFGQCAGWAHSLLFAAELPTYRKRLPLSLQAEMEAFKAQEQQGKAQARDEAKARKAAKVKKEEEGGEGDGEKKGRGKAAATRGKRRAIGKAVKQET